MKVEIKQPNSTEYYFRFDDEDDIFVNCMWARVILDHDNYTLTANTDCGNYSYSWQITPSEPFVKLMARINGKYLLDKISDRIAFDLRESKNRTIENLRNSAEDVDSIEIECMTVAIEGIECSGAESFYIAALGIVKYCEDIEIVKDYPKRAKTFCKIFTEYLQPLLREGFKDE